MTPELFVYLLFMPFAASLCWDAMLEWDGPASRGSLIKWSALCGLLWPISLGLVLFGFTVFGIIWTCERGHEAMFSTRFGPWWRETVSKNDTEKSKAIL